MMFKKISFCIFLMFISTRLLASDVPIIFIHGYKSEARPEDPSDKEKGGWKTWYPTESDGITLKHPTAMTKVKGYSDYQYGLKSDGSLAITCDINTQLMPDQGTKRIFNFSYYKLENVSRNSYILQEKMKIQDTLIRHKKVRNSFWRKWGFGIGYSAGFYYTGTDFRGFPFGFVLPFDWLYLLNSIEGGIFYNLNNRKRFYVGIEYGLTIIEDGFNYNFKLFPLHIGYFSNSNGIKTSLMYSILSYKSAGYNYKHRGTGIRLSFIFKINKVIAIGLNVGRVWYRSELGHKYVGSLNIVGINITLMYIFRPTRGVK